MPQIIGRLRELHVLPLFPPYLTPRINGATSTLTAWDRLALRLAVEHMLSWESWCIKTAKEHQARIDWKEKFKAENVDTAMASTLDALRTYEAGQEEQLSTRG